MKIFPVLDGLFDMMWPVGFARKVDHAGSCVRVVVATFILLSCEPAPSGSTPSDPVPSAPNPAGTYEGFGASTLGAKSSPLGWKTYTVTSLADSGPGTLRDAIVNRDCRGKTCWVHDSDPTNDVIGRLVVFKVAGAIVLESKVDIDKPYLTIDGSTAPSPGITIKKAAANRGQISVSTGTWDGQLAHHIIIRDIRFEGNWDKKPCGTCNAGYAGLVFDGGSVKKNTGINPGVQHIIIDHCTFRDITDGAGDMWGKVENVTWSWNLTFNSHHPMALSFHSPQLKKTNISLHHNVWAYNHERNPKIKHNVENVDYVNNIVYNWGLDGRPEYPAFAGDKGGYGLIIQGAEDQYQPTGVNIVNNVFLSDLRPQFAVFCDNAGRDGKEIFLSGNFFPPENVGCTADSLKRSHRPIPSKNQVTTWAARDLDDKVLAEVGMRFRDNRETSLLAELHDALRGVPGNSSSSSSRSSSSSSK